MKPINVVLVRQDGSREEIPFTWDASTGRIRYAQPVTVYDGDTIETEWVDRGVQGDDPMKRNEHLVQVTGSQIALAAHAEPLASLSHGRAL